MKKIKMAVLCPSEIAFRRFVPSLMKVESVEFVGVGTASEEEWFGKVNEKNNLEILDLDKDKAKRFVNAYGGRVFNSFDELIHSKDVDAIYIPLPPMLHYKWTKIALENGKHVFVEKPSTTNLSDTKTVVNIAREKSLVIYENYMFVHHNQIEKIEDMLKSGLIGNVRLFRMAFGFPFRGENDFRYKKELGGGALLDCGGYTIKLASRLLGPSTKVIANSLKYEEKYEVDIFGSGTLINDDGIVAQLSFGMDNSYKCEFEAWGSEGVLYTNRVFTAPDGYSPIISLTKKNETGIITLDSDDSFKKSIEHFLDCLEDELERNDTYNQIINQAALVEQFKRD